jgi:hypothetical protein
LIQGFRLEPGKRPQVPSGSDNNGDVDEWRDILPELGPKNMIRRESERQPNVAGVKRAFVKNYMYVRCEVYIVKGEGERVIGRIEPWPGCSGTDILKGVSYSSSLNVPSIDYHAKSGFECINTFGHM